MNFKVILNYGNKGCDIEMIYTLTCNPSIDYFLQVENFEEGIINRAKINYKYPGGKGINVSRVLNRLGIESVALGFVGGFTGEFIENYLRDEGIDTDFININEDTRINVKVKSSKETEINGEGPRIEEKELTKLFHKLARLTSEDFLVLSGNVQSSIPRDIYSKIQEKCIEKNIKVIVDATGEALILTLKNKPFLIKPNRDELKEIIGAEITTKKDIIIHGKKLMDLGAENVIISMGKEGAILICRDGIYYAEAVKGTVKSSVGAGDSLVGGFLAEYTKSEDIIEAFKWGISAGSSTAFSLDLCTKENVEKLLKEINIIKLE